MKEIPMLFSTPMVQAILEGRKMQTRRLVKMPKDDIADAKWGYTAFTPEGYISFRGVHASGQYGESFVKVPYCKGDLLYIRETWFPAAINSNRVLVGYHEKDPDITIEITTDRVEYYWKQLDKGRMIPSIHMPKEAARIWLQVASVKVERLQDISEEDAKAEGVELIDYYDIPKDGIQYRAHSYREAFESLWKYINGPESWEANPWVWCVSFKVLSTTGKPSLITEKQNNE